MWGILMDVALGKDVPSALGWLIEDCKSDIECLQSNADEVHAFFKYGIPDKGVAADGTPTPQQLGAQMPSGTVEGDALKEPPHNTEEGHPIAPPAPPKDPPALDATGRTGPLDSISLGPESEGEVSDPPPVRTSGRKTKIPEAFTAGGSLTQPAAPKKRKLEGKAPGISKAGRGSPPFRKNRVDSFWSCTAAFVRNAVSSSVLVNAHPAFAHLLPLQSLEVASARAGRPSLRREATAPLEAAAPRAKVSSLFVCLCTAADS